MRFFPVVDFQYVVLGLFLGVVCLILAFVAWGSYPRRRKTGAGEAPQETGEPGPPGRYESGVPRVTPFLVLLYAGIAAWAVLYMIVVGVRGGSF